MNPAATPDRRFTPGVAVVMANYAMFGVGLLLNFSVGSIDAVGAVLCVGALILSGPLIVATCCYSILRRYALAPRSWDLYGPALAIIGYLSVNLLMGRRPWWIRLIADYLGWA